MRLITKLSAFLALAILASCAKSGNKTQLLAASVCDKTVIIDKTIYNGLGAPNYVINQAVINGDCLSVTYSASGCDGRTWEVDLIDSETVNKTTPPQRQLKLRLVNNELCMAYFTKTVSFDITSLRESGSNSVALTLTGYTQPLVYQY